jgi:transposase-like protein
VTHYSKLAAEWMDAQGAKVGDKWNVDETMVSIDGDKSWVWNVMDSETRFLLATTVSRTRTMAATRAPLQKAKAATSTTPTEIRTDGMPAYPEAIKREFGRRHGPGDSDPLPKQGNSRNFSWFSPHKVVPSIRAPESNNIVERLNGSQRDRTRPMRGFDTMPGTAALMEGWRVHYDLVRTHLSLGKTPGEAAGLPAIPGFKWAEILKLATSRNVTPVAEGIGPDD